MEKYSLDTIIATLKHCAGIKICALYPSYQRADPHYEYIASRLESEISRYNSYDLQLSNGSCFSVVPELRQELLRGRRYHQIFLEKDVKASLDNRILIHSAGESLFKTGVFALFDELDEVKRAAAKVISDFSGALTLFELNVALENAKKLVQEATR